MATRSSGNVPPKVRPGNGSPVRINIGCGATPTDGWINFDNSFAVRVARWPLLADIVSSMRLLPRPSREFAKVASRKDVKFANASARIPKADNSVDVVYSSHMIEHLDSCEVRAFLQEVKRVLRPGAIVRLVVPDLALIVEDYLSSGDSDQLIANTNMCQNRPVGVAARLKLALIGPRRHLWMYDGPALVKLLSEAGFSDVMIMPLGKTSIMQPGNLDLEERASESVYVEAIKKEKLP